MAVYVCPVSAGADDYDDGGSSSTVVRAQWTNVPTPAIKWSGVFLCDTSAVPVGEKVVSCVFTLYEHAYTASKGLAKTYAIYAVNAGLALISTSGSRTYAGGWTSWTVPAAFYAYVEKGVGARTRFKTLIGSDPGPGKFRTFDTRSWENTVALFAAYVTVTTTLAERSQVIMVG